MKDMLFLTYLIPGWPEMTTNLGLVHEFALNESDDIRQYHFPPENWEWYSIAASMFLAWVVMAYKGSCSCNSEIISARVKGHFGSGNGRSRLSGLGRGCSDDEHEIGNDSFFIFSIVLKLSRKAYENDPTGEPAGYHHDENTYLQKLVAGMGVAADPGPS